MVLTFDVQVILSMSVYSVPGKQQIKSADSVSREMMRQSLVKQYEILGVLKRSRVNSMSFKIVPVLTHLPHVHHAEFDIRLVSCGLFWCMRGEFEDDEEARSV